MRNEKKKRKKQHSGARALQDSQRQSSPDHSVYKLKVVSQENIGGGFNASPSKFGRHKLSGSNLGIDSGKKGKKGSGPSSP